MKFSAVIAIVIIAVVASLTMVDTEPILNRRDPQPLHGCSLDVASINQEHCRMFNEKLINKEPQVTAYATVTIHLPDSERNRINNALIEAFRLYPTAHARILEIYTATAKNIRYEYTQPLSAEVRAAHIEKIYTAALYAIRNNIRLEDHKPLIRGEAHL
jgi:hypothetical protein